MKWTEEKIIQLAKNYQYKRDFREKKQNAYRAALARGFWSPKVYGHFLPNNLQSNKNGR